MLKNPVPPSVNWSENELVGLNLFQVHSDFLVHFLNSAGLSKLSLCYDVVNMRDLHIPNSSEF